MNILEIKICFHLCVDARSSRHRNQNEQETLPHRVSADPIPRNCHVMPDPTEHIGPNNFLRYHMLYIVFGHISQW